jgi:hypothetical protein
MRERIGSRSIGSVDYRQFNYPRLMNCATQLARWLNSRMILHFVQASAMETYRISFSTIARDSNLLVGYSRQRDAVSALADAFAELETQCTLARWSKAETRGLRSKIEDVVYTLTASRDFIAEQKAANKRQKDSRSALSVENSR